MSSSVAASARLATPSIFTRTFMLGLVGTLSAYLASWENADRVRDNYLDKNRDYGDTFDFIIVGAGTAGSILANRLSVKYKVLLLEAGGEPHPFQAIPLLSNYLLNYAELDWRHATMPQKQAFRGSFQSRASISQGRGLGGTSNLDYMMYLRGHPKDFDNWAEITEDPSWSYKSVSEFFKSLEQYSGPWASETHGDSGEMKIRPPSFTGLGEQFCQAAQSNGYTRTDLNSFFTEGCDIINYPTKKGYRDSVYSSFLKRVKDRWNLAIHKYAHVNKILIKGNNDTAYGVEYDRHGKSMVAYAKKEIILAAGALQTPKLLMLSGIGPKADLDSLGIPVKADLPVGKNLQDHLSVYLGPFFVERGRSLDIDRDVSARSVLSLAKDGGPLTTTGFQAAAVVSSGLEKLHGGRNWPDLQLTMYGISHHKSVEEDLSHAYKLKKDLLRSYLEHSKGLDSFSIVVSSGRPKSTGTVKLLNRNPYAPLIINPNYFDKIYDVVVMVDGVKKALRFVENSTVFYEDLNARFTRQILPGCETYRFRSDAYFECYVRTLSVSMGNVAGTASMGSVINSKLEIIGVKALRVMDSSVMPTIVTTSTGGAVAMIAEKGADMLLTKWEGTSSEADAGLLKDTNLVIDKIKEGATQMKLGLDGSKALLDTFKLTPVASKPHPSLQQFNLKDLQKITKSMGSLAAMLDPIAASSVQNNRYTGSFDLGTVGGANGTSKLNPFAAIATLTPMLKSQFGGLYQNLFDSVADNPVSGKSGNKTNVDIKLPLANDRDPLQLIQSMIKSSMKELKNITAMSSSVGASLQSMENGRINMTLEDIFGIADGGQDELEEYEIEELMSTTFTSTKRPPTKPTTKMPVKITRTPSTTTVKTTTTTETKSTTITTTKRPFIDYSYQVLPVPLAKSKEVSFQSHQASSVSLNPGQHQVQTIQIHPSPVPIHNVQSLKVPPVPIPPPKKLISSGPELQKYKNLEALAQIQHETLAKLKQKQQPKPQIIPVGRPPMAFQFQNHFRNPPPPPSQLHSHFANYPNLQQLPREPASPSLDILPPPPNGRFPPPQYSQKPGPPPPPFPPHHPLYDQRQQNAQRHPPAHAPPGLFRLQHQPGSIDHDPAKLKFAVHSIMNAKYAPPSGNPFAGVGDFRDHSQHGQRQNTDFGNGVLKSLQLRANVEKLINLPQSIQQVSPIPITHRPTPPPPSTIRTTPIPPPPIGPEQFEFMKQQQQQEDGGIFAPIKDVLQPFAKMAKLMKGPLSLLPNPFRVETTTTSSIASGIFQSFLPSSIFSQRVGPMSSSSSESYTIEQSVNPTVNFNKNPLSTILPRLLLNQSRFNGEVSPEVVLLALANLTSELPKPFVLEPSKSFTESSQLRESSVLNSDKQDKKLLDESISDILSHLKNHHFASITSSSDALSDDVEDEDSIVESAAITGSRGVNSANEILSLDYSRFPTTVKASIVGSTPKVRLNPPIEFHKSPWAKEPAIPSKSLHFKIKIV